MGSPKGHKKKDNGLNHILKYTGIFGMVQVLNMLMNIIRNKIAAIFLGPAGMGMLDMYNKASNLLSQSTNFGISISGVKHVSEVSVQNDHAKTLHYATTLRTYSVMVGLFGMLACICCHWLLRDSYETVNFLLISPTILMMAVTGGEMAILKGTRRLMRLTKVSVLVAFIILAVFAPFFYLMRSQGLPWALLVSQLLVMLATLHYSTLGLPYHIALFSRDHLRQGLPMLRLGIGLIIAGLFGQGSTWFINYFIEQSNGLGDVGLYNRGYTMAVVYASIIFSAMDADYYPRLSATAKDVTLQNQTINHQIEVFVLLIAPFLIFFAIGMPLIIPILFSKAFVPCISMSVGALLFMYFRALCLPVSYLALARGDSKMYMFTELVYDILIATVVPIVYARWGLTATGFTISACGLLDLLMIYGLYHWRYHFRFDFSYLWIYIIHGVLLGGAIALAFTTHGWVRWFCGGTLGVLSLWLSFHILSKETDFIKKLKNKFRRHE